ncbi:MAG: 4-(cytidine 5'-diphospho)-2-C-methyl-D-erythritol kinase [Chthoniobacterales bacterium]|nr:4-(cytidine 5'-diphospho)-2-C-methyl-D-erythritol kinase [Chthoniobacterales bacterium]
MQLRAPAKINLSLRILGQRADGFHEIETVMAPVSLYDQLDIELSGEVGQVELQCDDPSLPLGDDNLVTKAARLFFENTSMEFGVKIALKKNIPHGAGLGGGSSDAAAVLLALNELLGAKISKPELARLGAQLGSDVPFFMFCSPAICRGRGELIEPVVLPGSLQLLLLKPAFEIPTPWAYSRLKESRELPGFAYAPQEFSALSFVNHLERPVYEKHVFLGRMKAWLLEQAEVGAAMLSGSGSTVFAVLHNSSDAEALAVRAKAELDPLLWIYACETLNGS